MRVKRMGESQHRASAMVGKSCLRAIDVFVLAGGLGTRVRPVLGDVPKLLAPIHGRPFLAYLLGWLRRFGAQRIVFGLGHGAHAIVDYLRANPAKGLDVKTIVELKPLGTAGAIRFARGELRTDPVVIINGDSFVDADLCRLIKRHRALNARGTLLCMEVDDAGRFGRVLLDAEGRIRKFVEKDTLFRGTAIVNAGIYVLSSALLDDIAKGQAVSLEHDVFECMSAGSLGSYAGRFNFIDIGTPESLAAAGKILCALAV